MSECKHCWHNMGQYTDTAGTHRSEKCCHCGAFKTVDLTPPPFGGSGTGGTWVQPKHGPHVPSPTITW